MGYVPIPQAHPPLVPVRGMAAPIEKQRPSLISILVTAMAVAALYLLAFLPSFLAPIMIRREADRVAPTAKLSTSRLVARVALVTLVLSASLLLWLRWSDNRICVFHFSQDRSIVMRYNSFMAELEIPITYSVYVGSREVSPPFLCSGTQIPFAETGDNFRAFEFSDEKVVVQHRSNDPNYRRWETIVVHDFRAGRSWPKDWRLWLKREIEIDVGEGKPAPRENLLR
jgi:hypothetical protein